MDRARYIVGIDLGTTNCGARATSTRSASDEAAPIEVLPIPQLVDPGEVADAHAAAVVPLPAGRARFPGRAACACRGTPSADVVVGELARKRGAESPARLVASAKSWLSLRRRRPRRRRSCRGGARPRSPKVSPVDGVGARTCAHLRERVGRAHGERRPALRSSSRRSSSPCPASFDAEARELTLARGRAGGPRRTSRCSRSRRPRSTPGSTRSGDAWREQRRGRRPRARLRRRRRHDRLHPDRRRARRTAQLALDRVAVGDHILLGGDNMDLALARPLQQRLEADGHTLDAWQLPRSGTSAARQGDALRRRRAPDAARSRSSAAARKAHRRHDQDRAHARRASSRSLVDGFFPPVARRRAMPQRQRRVGLQELGLPYAADPAVTRHLARFLAGSRRRRRAAHPARRGRADWPRRRTCSSTAAS